MTMDELRHPDDERLSALAGADADALADTALRRHVDGCERCTGLIDDLRRLRAALAELPDLVPSRPIQLLPPVPEARPAAGWIRRAFAPALAAGVIMVVVGVIGLSGGDSADLFNTSRVLNGAPAGGQEASAAASTAQNTVAPKVPAPAAQSSSGVRDEGGYDLIHGSVPPSPSAAPVATPTAGERSVASSQPAAGPSTGAAGGQAQGGVNGSLVVLLGGILLIGAALVLRFVLVPRAG